MLWFAELGGMDGHGFHFLVCAPPRRVFVRSPRPALPDTPNGSCDEGLGMLVVELIPEPSGSPGTPVLASAALDTGRTIRVALDWCADAPMSHRTASCPPGAVPQQPSRGTQANARRESCPAVGALCAQDPGGASERRRYPGAGRPVLGDGRQQHRLLERAMSVVLPRCGDAVLHRPSGETWLVTSAEGELPAPSGWPNSIAQLAACEVLNRCSDAEHAAAVGEWRSVDDCSDSRLARVLRLYARYRGVDG
jgi:hypothetical protein